MNPRPPPREGSLEDGEIGNFYLRIENDENEILKDFEDFMRIDLGLKEKRSPII